jgi:hypothetical protein
MAPISIADAAGVEGVTPYDEQATRRLAVWRRIVGRELVDVRRLVLLGAVAAHTVEAEIVGVNERRIWAGKHRDLFFVKKMK